MQFYLAGKVQKTYIHFVNFDKRVIMTVDSHIEVSLENVIADKSTFSR